VETGDQPLPLPLGNGKNNMTIRLRKKVLLPLLLLGTVAVVATAATAAQGPKAPPDSRSVWADIQSGKAPKVPTPPGREIQWAGVWNGCKFVFLKSHVSSYQTPNGVAEVSERPDPLPPRGPDCEDREPTDAEINDMRAHVTTLNASRRADGAPRPPELPPAQARVPLSVPR
jgi:hypothetical protein